MACAVVQTLEDNPQITVHGFRHAGIHNVLGLLMIFQTDEPDIEIDEVTETVTPPLLVSDVYIDSQTEEKELEADEIDSETNDVVIISDSE